MNLKNIITDIIRSINFNPHEFMYSYEVKNDENSLNNSFSAFTFSSCENLYRRIFVLNF
jgi:hypothetical protein